MNNQKNSYWAEFKKFDGDLYRFDTRIYIHEIEKPSEEDKCIGAIVGKNPGSAKPFYDKEGLVPICLDGDKLLPTVKSIVNKSLEKASRKMGSHEYIQVLNLFYLCEEKLSDAKKKHTSNLLKPDSEFEWNCTTEKKKNEFEWLWFVWGGYDKDLNDFKERFIEINAKRKFYFDDKFDVHENFPSNDILAKHTQGLKHDSIIPFFENLFLNKI